MLTKEAKNLIGDYISLPFKHIEGVRCPYINNARLKQRGQLRALIGKGTPDEIVEEAEIAAKQYGIELEKLNSKETREFLIEKNIGIECSGFVIHILREQYLKIRNTDILKEIKIPAKNFFRKIINKLRPAENINVKVLSNDENSEKIDDWKNIQAGDMIILLDTKLSRDHIILITDFTGDIIKYVHARAWSSEGKYGHGVNTGEIKITHPQENLLKQEWIEKSFAQKDDLFHQEIQNETFAEAKNAKILEIRRLKI